MSTIDTTYRLFRSSDPGAPTLQNTAGDITDIYYACLVSGYGSITLTSLVVASGIATATYSGGHGHSNFGALSVGPVINISGITDLTGLNGDKRITVTSSTEFTFDATGISDGTASGTIVAKVAPAGWAAIYNDTNKYAFQSTDPGASGILLRVTHLGTTYGTVYAYESMSDIDTGTDAFPTGLGYILGSDGATARAWIMVATSKSFVFLSDYLGDGTCPGGHGIDELSNVAGTNSWGVAHYVQTSSSTSAGNLYPYGTTSCYLERTSDGLTKHPTGSRYGPAKAGTYSCVQESPTPPNSGYYYIYPRFVWYNSEIIGQCQILHSGNFDFSTSTPFSLFYEAATGSYAGMVFLAAPNTGSTLGTTLRVA